MQNSMQRVHRRNIGQTKQYLHKRILIAYKYFKTIKVIQSGQKLQLGHKFYFEKEKKKLVLEINDKRNDLYKYTYMKIKPTVINNRNDITTLKF